MHPILIRLPFLDFAIYSYGPMMVLGFLAAYLLSYRFFKRCGQDLDELTNVLVLGLLGGVAGARALYVIHFWDKYADGPLWQMFNVRDGGLEFYGGVIMALVVGLGYMTAKKLPIRLLLDMLPAVLMLGLAFGRMGCFLNGCCHGKISELPWAMSFPYGSAAYYDHVSAGQLSVPAELSDGFGGAIGLAELSDAQRAIAAGQRSLPVHPAQLYSMAVALVLSWILYRYFWRRKYEGQCFVLMLILYGVARFGLEMLRTEPLIGRTGLSISQNLSIIAVIGGLIWWVWVKRRPAGQVDPKTGRVIAAKSNIKHQRSK